MVRCQRAEWPHGVAQPDVHLIAQPRPPEVRVELGAQPEDGRLGADRPDGNRVEGKLDAVVLHSETQEVAEEFAQPFLSEIDRPKQVDVARGACVRAEPMAKEQRALEDEVVAVRRTSQAVQEAFDGVQLQQLGKGAAALPRRVLEACLNGVDERAGLRAAHCSASR